MASVKGARQLQARLHAIGGPQAGRKVMQRVGLSTVREAKLLVARKTGNLGRSIHMGNVTDTSASVIAGARYAAYVEFGTRPHEITPNARKALRFAATAAGRRLSGSPRVGAAVVFAKRVHHPGTRPQPYLLPGARKAVAGADLKGSIIEEWNGAA